MLNFLKERLFDSGDPGALYLTISQDDFFLRVQDNCVQAAIRSATAAGTALCFANNQLMSSSAHHYPVISLRNNPAASEMWQEAEAPQT